MSRIISVRLKTTCLVERHHFTHQVWAEGHALRAIPNRHGPPPERVQISAGQELARSRAGRCIGENVWLRG